MKKMVGKWIALTLALVMVLSLAGCGGSGTPPADGNASDGGSGDKLVFVIAHVDPEDANSHIGCLNFEKTVEEKSNGRIDVQVYPNGQLGGEREEAEGCAMGSIQMALISSSVMSCFGEKFNLLDLPFIFDGYEDANAAYDGEVGQIYAGWMEEQNLHNGGFYCNGFRGICNSKVPVRTPADMKGLKIRVMETDMMLNMFKAFGANPTPMSWNEIYTGMEQGTIDGHDVPAELCYASKLHENAKYYSATNHGTCCISIIQQKDYLDGLDSDLRTIIDEATAELCAFMRDACEQGEMDAIAAMQEEGVEYIKLTPEETALFQECVKPIYEEYKEIAGEDVMNLVLS